MTSSYQPLRDRLAAALALIPPQPLADQLNKSLALVDQAIAAEAPPVIVDGRVRQHFLDLRALLAFQFQYLGYERYERYEEDKLLRTTTGTLRFFLTDEKAGGKTIVGGFRHPVYKVFAWPYTTWEGEGDPPLAKGVLIATYTRTGTESSDPTTANPSGTNKGGLASYSLPPPDVFPDVLYTFAIIPCNAAGVPIVPLPQRGAQDYESSWFCRVWLNRMGKAGEHPFMLLENDTFDLTHEQNLSGDGGADGSSMSQWQVLPKALGVTRAYPSPVRTYTAFGNYPAKRQMYREQFVPHIIANGSRPCKHSDGRITTNMRQGYFIEHARMKYPPLAIVDGDRNIATCYFPTLVAIGHNGGSYHANPWSALRHRLNNPGKTIITLIGAHHVEMPDADEAYNGTTPHLRQAGDWSRVDPTRRFVYRCWGGCWVRSSIRQGSAGNPIIGDEVTHDADVIWIWADGHDCLREGRFNGHDPNRGTPIAEPPRIREISPPGSIRDGWNIDEINGFAYVAERGRHRVAIWKLPTVEGGMATFVGLLLGEGQEDQANALVRFEDAGIPAGARHYHRVLRKPGVTVSQVRALDAVGVEGLRILVDVDGKPWMTTSGLAIEEVRRWPLAFNPDGSLRRDGAYSVVCRFPISQAGKSHFGLHSISREAVALGKPGFGPPWLTAAWTFSDSEQGWPVLFKPATPRIDTADGRTIEHGSAWTFSAFYDPVYASSGTYSINVGAGGVYCRNVYSMAHEIGGPSVPVMEGGGSDEGLFRWSLAQPTDPLPNYRSIEAGAAKYRKAGLDEFWGPGGYSKYDADALPLPEPYASDPDIRAFIAWEQQA